LPPAVEWATVPAIPLFTAQTNRPILPNVATNQATPERLSSQLRYTVLTDVYVKAISIATATAQSKIPVRINTEAHVIIQHEYIFSAIQTVLSDTYHGLA
jgi:hypothetical protein